MSKMKFLMGATALIAANAAAATGAQAQVSTYLYSAGSSLAAPYLRQAFDCSPRQWRERKIVREGLSVQ